jgi:hypothetical protein
MLERNLGNRRQTRIRVLRNPPAMKLEGHMYGITESLSPIVAVLHLSWGDSLLSRCGSVAYI